MTPHPSPSLYTFHHFTRLRPAGTCIVTRHVMQSSVLITTKKKQQFLKKELSTQRKLESRSRAQDPTKVKYRMAHNLRMS